jgi:hypothetical protein
MIIIVVTEELLYLHSKLHQRETDTSQHVL